MAAGRRILKGSLIGLVAALLVVVAAVVALVVAVHTDWGRETARQRALTELAPYVRGDVSVGSISGSLLGRFSLHDVVITDEEGNVVIAAERVTIDYAPRALIRKQVLLDRVEVEAPTVHARVDAEGQLNLAELFVAPEPDPEDEPLAVTLGELEMSRGSVDYAVEGDQVVALTGIALEAAADVSPPSGLSVQVAEFAADVALAEPDAEVSIAARGDITRDDDAIEARDVQLSIGGSTVQIPELVATSAADVRGEIALALRADEARKFLPGTPIAGDLELTGTISREGSEEPIRIALSGATAGAPTTLHALLAPEVPRAHLELEVQNLDPSAAVASAPPGQVSATVRATAWAEDPDDPRVEVEVSASGSISDQPIERAELTAALRGDEVTGNFRARLPGARARGDAVVSLAGDTPSLTRGEVSFAVANLPALTRGEVDVRGSIEGTITASGPFDALAVEGEVTGDELRTGDVSIGAARADVALEQVPGAPTGRAVLSLRGVRTGDVRVTRARAAVDLLEEGRLLSLDLSAGTPLDPYGARGQATIDLREETTRARISSLRVRTRDLVWRADDTAIAIAESGRIDVEQLEIRSDAGRIAVQGWVRGEEAGDLDVEVSSLDIGRALAAVAPDAPPADGVVDLDAQASWDPARGSVSGSIAGLALPALPTLDVDVDAQIADQRLTGSLEAAGLNDERVSVQLAARTPDPIYDLEAWRRVGGNAIDRLELEVRNVGLDVIAEALGQDAPRGGTLELSAELGPRLSTASVNARVVDFDYGPGWPTATATLDAQLEGRGEQRRLRAALHASIAGDQRARVEIATRAPAEILDPGAWEALGTDAAESVVVELESIALPALAQALGVPPPETGELSLLADVGPALASGTVSASVDELSYGAPLPTVSAEVNGELDGRDASLAARLTAAPVGKARISLEAALPPGDDARSRFDPDALAALGPGAVRRANAGVQVDLRELARAVPGAPSLTGTIAASARAGEGLSSADLRVRGSGLLFGELERPMAAAADVVLEPSSSQIRADASLEPARGQARAPRVAAADLELGVGTDALLAGELGRFTVAPASGEILARAPLALVGRAAGIEVPLGGVLRSKLEVQGSLEKPILTAWLDGPGITLAGVDFEELRGVARFADRRLRAKLRARQDAGRLDFEAAIPLDEPSAGTLEASARDFDLAFLAAIVQPTSSAILDLGGQLSAELSARADPSSPDLEGFVRLENGHLDFANLRPLRDAQVELQIRDGRAELEARARSDRGRFRILADSELDGLEPTSLSGTVRTDNFPIPTVPGVPLALDLRAKIGGTKLPTELWRFDVTADRVLVNLPEGGDRRALGPTGELEDVRVSGEDEDEEAEPVRPEDRRPVALIRLHTPNDVVVRGEEVGARIETDLRVTLLASGVSVEGSAQVARGHLRLFDRPYDIDRARVAFEGRVPPTPRIDVRLSHQFTTATLYIDATGTAEDPQIRFASDPAIYDQAQLLGFALGGNPDTGADPGGEPQLEERAAGAASALIAQQVGDALKRAFPIDVLRIGAEDPAEGIVGFVTVGKWVNDDLFVAYRRRIEDDEAIHEANLEYQIFRNWTIEGAAGPDQGSVDLLWIRRY